MKLADLKTGKRAASLELVAGAALVGLVVGAALLAPWLAPYAPEHIQPETALAAPGPQHWFGVDALGRDLLSRVLFGARYSLGMSLCATALSILPGLALGLLGGYCSGWVDRALSRLVDILLALPGVLLALVLAARLGPSLGAVALALGVSGIPGIYRVVRAETRALARQPFIEAAEALGAGAGRVMRAHLLPNLLPTLIILCTMRVGVFLLAGSGLSFIGLGAQPPQPEWGALLVAGKDYYTEAWWLAAFPGLAIGCAVLGFNLLGDGLRAWFTPR